MPDSSAAPELVQTRVAREVGLTFHQLTGLSLELRALARGALVPANAHAPLCPVAASHQHKRLALPPQCGQCVHFQWLSSHGQCQPHREWRGPCGCLWADLYTTGNHSLSLMVRGAPGALPEPAKNLLRLISRGLQAECQFLDARHALAQAELRIESLEQQLPAKNSTRPRPAMPLGNRRLAEAIRAFAHATRVRASFTYSRAESNSNPTPPMENVSKPPFTARARPISKSATRSIAPSS